MPEQLEAVKLIQNSNEAVLGTLEEAGPFTSAVSYFWMAEGQYGKLILLMSGLARHSKNLMKNPAASMLILEPGSAFIYERRRVAVQGQIRKVESPQAQIQYKETYRKFFPQSGVLFQLPDFHFCEMNIRELYFIGGFGKIQFFK
jgi:hypothetical protein